jgi:hypothetical protein
VPADVRLTLTGGRGMTGGLRALREMVPWPVCFGADIFQTASTAWDERFVSHSSRVRTVALDAGNVATTEFALTPARADGLVASGRAAASSFLDAFDLGDDMNAFHDGIRAAAASS